MSNLYIIRIVFMLSGLIYLESIGVIKLEPLISHKGEIALCIAGIAGSILFS